MKIIVDAFGGDNSPDSVIKGAYLAAKDNIDIILTGKQSIIESKMKEFGLEPNPHITIVNAEDKILGEDEPVKAIKEKKDSSMVVGLRLLADGVGDAFVSAGNTGAVLAGATLIIRRLKGIKRAALATVIPTAKGPAILTDCGSNVVCKPEYYPQFAMMGSAYLEAVIGEKNPKVGLINIGTEETKGTETVLEAYALLKENSNINFGGNCEARDVLKGDFKVMVADGFTGNVILKVIEGVAKEFTGSMKEMFFKNIATKVSALIMKKGLKEFKKKYDYKEHGGAPILGLNKPVIKAHGSSNDYAIYKAIIQADTFAKQGVIEKIQKNI
ncbi:MAG: phosphate acyltransferase PlsX [Clostridia bacterium]|nr:phosphate acyltransferase PlsX [Clostridia bacterium]